MNPETIKNSQSLIEKLMENIFFYYGAMDCLFFERKRIRQGKVCINKHEIKIRKNLIVFEILVRSWF